MRHLIFTLLFVIISSTLIAQKETYNWYFGDHAGLTFRYGSPIFLSDSKHFIFEGCATMSDSAGNLLFYTDGETVWTKEHTVMENGTDLKATWIGANVTTTQSAIIIPIPKKPNQYMLFSLEPQALTHSDGELGYSVVDMAFNDGLGKVTKKNVCIADSIAEKMTAIQHSNGQYYWLVVSEFTTNKMFSFLITEGGVQSPVISTLGEPYKAVGYSQNATGYMKFSPKGNRIAAVNFVKDIEVYDFDNLTGRISNPISFEGFEGVYGLAFSPDGSKIYVSSLHHITQYDLTSSDISAPYIMFEDHQNEINTALQLGPDGVIYHSSYLSLNAILHPNLKGKNALFINDYIDLPVGASGEYGLPNFVQSYFANITIPPHLDVFDNKACVGDSIKLAVTSSSTENIKKVTWHIGDVVREYSSFAGLQTDIVFTQQGQYPVSAFVEYHDKPNIFLEDTIAIYQLTTFLTPDTLHCPGDTIYISVPDEYEYEWPDYHVRNGKPYITKPGKYILKYGIGNCWTQDTIVVNFGKTRVSLGSDQYLCRKELNELILSPFTNGTNYEWQDGSSSATFSVTESGTYWVKVGNVCGWDTDTVRIWFHEDSLVSVGEDKILCKGDIVKLVASGNFPSYQWESDHKGVIGYDQSLVVSEPGTYWVTSNNFCGAFTDTIQVFYENYTPLNLGISDTIRACVGETVSLRAGPYYRKYKWSNGSKDSVVTVSETNTYQVKVENSCGTQTDQVYVEFNDPSISFIPNVITPNQDGMNDYFILDKKLKGCKLQIFNRWGKRIYISDYYTNEWDAPNIPSGVYNYMISHPCLQQSIGGRLNILSP